MIVSGSQNGFSKVVGRLAAREGEWSENSLECTYLLANSVGRVLKLVLTAKPIYSSDPERNQFSEQVDLMIHCGKSAVRANKPTAPWIQSLNHESQSSTMFPSFNTT